MKLEKLVKWLNQKGDSYLPHHYLLFPYLLTNSLFIHIHFEIFSVLAEIMWIGVFLKVM